MTRHKRPGAMTGAGIRRCLLAGLAAALAVVSLGSALHSSQTASPWRVAGSPNVSGRNGLFSGVSCSVSTSCMAVGSYESSGPQDARTMTTLPLVGARSAEGWTVQTAPGPENMLWSPLNAVSCTSPNACTAVGEYFAYSVGNTNRLFAERWDGHSWHTQVVPANGYWINLRAVSCGSPTSCMAVGHHTTQYGGEIGLAEYWNGTTWSKLATPPSSSGAVLTGVACTSGSVCMAAGFDDQGPLVDQWARGGWTESHPPLPSHAASGALKAIACTSPAFCVAAGQYLSVGGFLHPLVVRLKGGSWTLQGVRGPRGAEEGTLSGVSCSSASSCVTVGMVREGQEERGFAERWDGLSWAPVAVPMPGGAFSSKLDSVSCPSPAACLAAGSYVDRENVVRTLAERWDGKGWSVETTSDPEAAIPEELSAVSCSSAGACTAVGEHGAWCSVQAPPCIAPGQTTRLNPEAPLAERWNGRSWRIQPTPMPPGGELALLQSVSCPTSSFCMAVGLYIDGAANQVPLAELWNGRRWSVEPTAPLPGDILSDLDGVSCPKATTCTAVGSTSYMSQQTGGLAGLVLMERWSGRAWARQSAPRRPAGYPTLAGVSCVTVAACVGVGFTGTYSIESPIAQAWYGSHWRIQTVPAPSGGGFWVLDGVSCVSAALCVAVGPGLNEYLANGKWRLERVPALAGDQSLDAVSCVPTGSCVSVGGPAILVQRRAGVGWTFASEALPSGASPILLGISCPSAGECVAAGATVDGRTQILIGSR